MGGIGKCAKPWIAPLRRKGVLGQIIGADGKEIRRSRKLFRRQRGTGTSTMMPRSIGQR